MNFKILSLFPETIKPYLDASILGRAQKNECIKIEYFNIRDYTLDKHRKVDDTPYGGGFGMIMAPQPVLDCHASAVKNETGKLHTIYLSPAGRKFDHKAALELKEYDTLVFICGHYEGIDERIITSVVDEEFSVGDYVLTGGELPCALMIDAISRLIDGVLPDSECYEGESIASGILEHPQYTRPAVFNGLEVPEVLRGGNHADIVKWQREKALEKTLLKRPELFDTADLTKEDMIYLEKYRLSEKDRG